MFKKILVATDGSPLSIAAASAAIEFAAASGASLVGLSLAQFYPFLLMPEAGAMVDLSEYEEAQDQMAQQAVKKLEEAVKHGEAGHTTEATAAANSAVEHIKQAQQIK